MIELQLSPEMAVSVMQALIAEQKGYTYDETCCPLRIVAIRGVIEDLDIKLDAYYDSLDTGSTD
jgi:hypothetical protein